MNPTIKQIMDLKPVKGIVVDGACSGNPGPGEYRGVNLETGDVLFHQKFSYTTNNIMEFCGIVHALKYRKENKFDLQIYSDSQTALAWVEKKKTNSSLEPLPSIQGKYGKENVETMFAFIANCERWLIMNIKNHVPVSKWLTKEWGEIPADFGNKGSFSFGNKGGNNFDDNKKNTAPTSNKKLFIPAISKQELKQYIEAQEQSPIITDLEKHIYQEIKTEFKL